MGMGFGSQRWGADFDSDRVGDQAITRLRRVADGRSANAIARDRGGRGAWCDRLVAAIALSPSRR